MATCCINGCGSPERCRSYHNPSVFNGRYPSMTVEYECGTVYRRRGLHIAVDIGKHCESTRRAHVLDSYR